MRIGVLSDTHGNNANTQSALAVFEKLGAERLIHCGDWDTRDLLSLFSGWTLDFVFGNMDVDQEAIRDAARLIGAECHGEFGAVRWAERRIAFLHGHRRRVLQRTIASGEWDLVCWGHSHEPQWERVGPTLVVNPGALHRVRVHTVALIDLASLEVQHVCV